MSRFTGRGRRTGRILRAAAGAGVRRLIRHSAADDRRLGEALVAELDAMKGMAMKVGQILSYMDGTLPEETQAVLSTLQTGRDPEPLEVVLAVIEAALGEGRFDRIDPQAIAAASIGQVHRGSVGGVEVAIKVQYPGVEASFEADMAQLHRLAALASMATAVDGAALVEELRARLLEECDYRTEANNLTAFQADFDGVPGVILPSVLPGHSARTVLTTTWCEGVSLQTFIQTASVPQRQAAAQTLARFAWRSLLGLGRINADPHPGNYRMMPEGVAFLDFGCVRRFEPAVIAGERRLIAAVLSDDAAAFRRAALDSGMVADPRRFDFAMHQAFYTHLWAPCRTPGFRIDRDYFLAAQRFSGPGNPNLRRMAIPPWWIWIQRLHWGLLSVIGRLDVPVELGEVLEECLALPTPTR
jgi:predicted unusual protein kinase regulating ubiquinone biosynthesis (AarF/ABC1/UbiB family)